MMTKKKDDYKKKDDKKKLEVPSFIGVVKIENKTDTFDASKSFVDNALVTGTATATATYFPCTTDQIDCAKKRTPLIELASSKSSAIAEGKNKAAKSKNLALSIGGDQGSATAASSINLGTTFSTTVSKSYSDSKIKKVVVKFPKKYYNHHKKGYYYKKHPYYY